MKRHTPLKRGGPIKRKRPKREAETMGSRARREFVASLPCSACGIHGYSQNAHLQGSAGMGLKKAADTIGPLCRSRTGIDGCHDLYDGRAKDGKRRFWERFPTYEPAWVALRTERLWQQHQQSKHAPESVGAILPRVLADVLQRSKDGAA
jgi:hypothetical protein